MLRWHDHRELLERVAGSVSYRLLGTSWSRPMVNRVWSGNSTVIILSFPFALNKLRRRAVQRMAMLAGVSTLDHRLSNVAGLLDAEEKQLDQSPSAVDRLRVAVGCNPQIHQSLAHAQSLLNLAEDLTLGSISDLLVVGRSRSEDLIAEVQSLGIYVSPAESLAIEAHRAALRADEDMRAPTGI